MVNKEDPNKQDLGDGLDNIRKQGIKVVSVDIPSDWSEMLKPEWKEMMKAGILEQLENYELFCTATSEQPATALNLSPFSFSGGLDERNFVELSPVEKWFLKKEMFDNIGLDPKNPEKVGEYQFTSPDENLWKGNAKVTIYKTGRSDEDMYLHHVKFPDDKEEFLIAPQEYR